MRNIRLAYVLSYLNASWFWLGVWVMYYLRFTNIAGIGLLESIMIATATLTEIPSGAVADLLGKKKTLTLAFLLSGMGNLVMGVAPSFSILILSIITMTIGGSFYSGTFEALLYDSLKEHKKEAMYNRVIANAQSIRLVAFGVSGAVGGFMYAIAPGLPFLMVGACYLLGSLITLGLIEPKIDSEKFSLDNYLIQTRQGFAQLFKSSVSTRSTLVLLTIGIFVVIGSEVLNDVQMYQYGFSEITLGILASMMYLLAAFISNHSHRLIDKLGGGRTIILSAWVLMLTLVLSFKASVLIGVVLIAARWGWQTIIENTTSVIVNDHTESRCRATTLSTYQLLLKLPYVLSAFVIGTLIDRMTANVFAFYLGVGLLLVLMLMAILNHRGLYLFSYNKKPGGTGLK